jgi:hypothetical protein
MNGVRPVPVAVPAAWSSPGQYLQAKTVNAARSAQEWLASLKTHRRADSGGSR